MRYWQGLKLISLMVRRWHRDKTGQAAQAVCLTGKLADARNKKTPERVFDWLREPDSNRRPSGYEPDELPGCSIPRPICWRFHHDRLFCCNHLKWLREPDLNRRPSGYEPDELPGCSIPRPNFLTLPSRQVYCLFPSGNWLREPDSNRRPSGYEPDELPGCSIPRPWMRTILSDDFVATPFCSLMAKIALVAYFLSQLLHCCAKTGLLFCRVVLIFRTLCYLQPAIPH